MANKMRDIRIQILEAQGFGPFFHKGEWVFEIGPGDLDILFVSDIPTSYFHESLGILLTDKH